MSGLDALAQANAYCAALVREHARDEWLGALYAPPERRDALIALAAFDYEIRQARFRARDPNLVAMRLAWRREVLLGDRREEGSGDPVMLALAAAVQTYALPLSDLEAMLDARLQELQPQDDFTLHAFENFADESEGARLRLAARISAGGREHDEARADLPAGAALALTRMLFELPVRAGAAPTLFPVDVAARHGASLADFDARRATPAVRAACAEMRALAREKLVETERRLKPPIRHREPRRGAAIQTDSDRPAASGSLRSARDDVPALPGSAAEILPAFIPLGALPLDLDALDRASDPFAPIRKASPLRRQWAIWRWARRRQEGEGVDRSNPHRAGASETILLPGARCADTYKRYSRPDRAVTLKQPRITQREVANAAGVSQATVSMVLSGGKTAALPAETYEKVLAAARRLGYVPNRSAQALKTNRTMTLACVVPDVANPFYPSLMRGVQSAADAAGYDVIAVNTDGSAARERRFLDWSLRGTIDGVVGVFFTLRAPDFTPLAQAGVCIVRIETSAKRGGALPIDNLFVDNVAAAGAATVYLIERGHRQIAMIAGLGGPEKSSDRRLSAGHR